GHSSRQAAQGTGRKASARASAGQQEQTHSRRAPHAGVRTHHRHARSLAARDRWGDLVALRCAGRALRQPPRPADGTAAPPAPDVQAAVRRGLSCPSTGPYTGRGPHRTYGDKVDSYDLSLSSLKATTVEGHMQTCLYQMQLLHKEFTQPLHV